MSVGLAASIHPRLLNRTKARGEDFNLILTRYAIERFFYSRDRRRAGFAANRLLDLGQSPRTTLSGHARQTSSTNSAFEISEQWIFSGMDAKLVLSAMILNYLLCNLLIHS